MMVKYPSINQFRHVVESVKRQAEFTGLTDTGEAGYDAKRAKPSLTFTGHVKLHGTNAGIGFVPNGAPVFQSRERVLAPGAQDNAGFAQWGTEQGAASVEALRQAAESCRKHPDSTLHVYGEWVGRGINPKTAIGSLPDRLVVFGLKETLVPATDNHPGVFEWLSVEMLAQAFWGAKGPVLTVEESVQFITDFKTYEMTIDFNRPEDFLAPLEALTLEVETCCPVAQALGKEGLGEGIVWTCQDPVFGHLTFKTKGEKHKGTKNARLVQIEPEVLASLDAFVDAVLTESRLEQGLEQVRDATGRVTLDQVGAFLKWVGQDVMKEELDTLQASGLDRKQAMGRINHKAKAWLMPRLAQV